MTRNALTKRLKSRGIITSAKGLTTKELQKIWRQAHKVENLPDDRKSVGQRLIHRGILKSIKGVPTQELHNLWEKYKYAPPMEDTTPIPEADNYQKLVNMIANLAESFEDFFVGRFHDAWRYLPELKFLWQRIDKEAINSDDNFIPKDVVISEWGTSDWYVDDNFRMMPDEVVPYAKTLWGKYLR